MLFRSACFAIRKFLWSEVGQYSEKNYWKRKAYQCMAKVPVETIFYYYKKLIHISNARTSELVRILLFPTPNNTFGLLSII